MTNDWSAWSRENNRTILRRTSSRELEKAITSTCRRGYRVISNPRIIEEYNYGSGISYVALLERIPKEDKKKPTSQ